MTPQVHINHVGADRLVLSVIDGDELRTIMCSPSTVPVAFLACLAELRSGREPRALSPIVEAPWGALRGQA